MPFRNRRVRGWVTRLQVNGNPKTQLLRIERLRSKGPPLQVVELARWVSWRWAGKLSGLLSTASSPRIVHVQAMRKSNAAKPLPASQYATVLPDNMARIDAIYRFIADAGIRVSGWQGLQELQGLQGLQGDKWQEGLQGSSQVRCGPSIVELPQYSDSAEFVASLLSSTSTYLDALSRSFESRDRLSGNEPSGNASSMQGVIILCPTYLDVRHMYRKLQADGFNVARMPDEWHIARQGNCIALGTRQAVFSPLPDVSIIIVLSAHDSLYQEERAPLWNAWQVAVHRASMANAPCLLVTPYPTLSMVKDCGIEPMEQHTSPDASPSTPPPPAQSTLSPTPLSVPPSTAQPTPLSVPPSTAQPTLPSTPPSTAQSTSTAYIPAGTSHTVPDRQVVQVRVVDLTKEAPGSGVISDELKYAVRWAMADSTRKVLMVQNRFSKMRLPTCSSCNRIPRCPVCNNVLRITGEPAAMLSCPRCNYSRTSTCSYCSGHDIREMSSKLSRLRQTLSDYFGVPVLEVVGDAREHSNAKNTVKIDRSPTAPSTGMTQLILGTEAVLYRYDIADIVIFVDIDTDLLAPRLNASEEVMTMLGRAQAITRSSLYTRPTIIQTRATDHPLIRAVLSGNHAMLLNEEMRIRRELSLPPHTAIARIAGAGAQDFVSTLLAASDKSGAYSDIVGQSSTHPLRAGKQPDDSWLVIANDHDTLCNLLSSAARPREQLRIYVDPPSI